MLTRLTVRNFKRFEEVVIELGNPVVFIGPNNSGKTSALQALALWDAGLKRWNEKRHGKMPEVRPGVTVNRRDLVTLPVPEANLLWRDLRVRDGRAAAGSEHGTRNIRIEIVVDGMRKGRAWRCGVEFDYANEESFYCRPLRLSAGHAGAWMEIPDQAQRVRVALLPPLSGLATTETRLDSGAVNVRIGEGRTAEVLRNLCYRIHEASEERWQQLVSRMQLLFRVELLPPRYLVERGEIVMAYRERDVTLDLSSAGRGLQQTLLLLAYLYANPDAVLLLDEPDAHLEVLRQRQTYHLLREVANANGSQIVVASHSEVLLHEAVDRDTVVAFVGRPHRVDDRGSQVLKALRDIGFDQYYQAEETGWVLYLEGSTDLSILIAFARRLGHERALRALERPFVHYVGNQPRSVQAHYHGLREALPSLRGVVVFDRLDTQPRDIAPVECLMWRRREIENYVCSRATLEAYATASAQDTHGPLFSAAETERRLDAMRKAIDEMESALTTLRKGSPWDPDIKASDDFLTRLFEIYFEQLALPNLMAKKNFHELADCVPDGEIDPEIREKLDVIARVADAAASARDRE